MSKKIKQLAEEAFPIKCWEEARASNDCRKIFCKGANAVLEEIETFSKLFCNKFDGYSIPVDCILGKLRELKGEIDYVSQRGYSSLCQ